MALPSYRAFQPLLVLPAWATPSCSARAQSMICPNSEAGLRSTHEDNVGVGMTVSEHQSSATALLYFLTQSHVAQVIPKLLVFLTLPLKCWNCRHVSSRPLQLLVTSYTDSYYSPRLVLYPTSSHGVCLNCVF